MGILIVIIFVLILYWIFDAISKYVNYTSSPNLSRYARIITKRQNVSGSQYATATYYYVTFEFYDGSREEFQLKSKEYGLLAEGDRGTVYSKGRRFLGFDRL